jgi:ribonuclease III
MKDWYKGLLRFLPKSILEQFKLKDDSKNFPNLGYFDSDMEKKLENMIGTRINNIAYYEQALTHRSYIAVMKEEFPNIHSNERLEFLGDSVLGLVITDYLFNYYFELPEGELTKLRQKLVNKHTLANVGKNIELQQFLKISFGTERNFDKGGDTIIADAVEALIAAIYIDSGIEKTIAFIYKNIIQLLESDSVMFDSNYKSRLLELVQSNGHRHPIYRVLIENGPDHNKEYTIGVFVGDMLLGTGTGKNKKDAEQNSAKDAISNLNI